MEPYIRAYPGFALCGLNCALCPRHHAAGVSRCPGCGGDRFNELHPACPIITCGKRHGNIEFCHECATYPCERYRQNPDHDSFITYQRRVEDQLRAKTHGIQPYREELEEKSAILKLLLATCDDGRHKGYFCLAVNLLSLEALKEIVDEVEDREPGTKANGRLTLAVRLMEDHADREGVMLRLRSKT